MSRGVNTPVEGSWGSRGDWVVCDGSRDLGGVDATVGQFTVLDTSSRVGLVVVDTENSLGDLALSFSSVDDSWDDFTARGGSLGQILWTDTEDTVNTSETLRGLCDGDTLILDDE